MADTSLFQLLAQANSDDSGALADAKSAAGALNSIFGGFRAQKEYNRQQKMKDMLDQKLPADTLEQIFGSSDALPQGLSLGGLKEIGGGSLLKNNSADFMTTAALLSGGDKTKMKGIFEELKKLGKKPKINPATVQLYTAMKPKQVVDNTDINALRALQTNLNAQLKGDLSAAEEEVVRDNLDLVNMQIAALGGVGKDFKKPIKNAKPAKAAPAPAPVVAPEKEGLAHKILSFFES